MLFLRGRCEQCHEYMEGLGWRAEHALQTLLDKCLVEITRRDPRVAIPETIDIYEPPYNFRMHDHLRDLGRDIADTEISRPHRLWHRPDLVSVFSHLEMVCFR